MRKEKEETIRVCLNFCDFNPSKRTVKCLKKGVVRSWNCPLFSITARCRFLEPIELPRRCWTIELEKYLVNTESRETLCSKCIFGVQTVQQGSFIYYCNYRKTYRRYIVEKCPWFQERKKEKTYAKVEEKVGLERWL